MDHEDLTDKQREVLNQVHELLTEHFEGMVYVVNVADVGGGTDVLTCGGFNGGHAMAMGLCTFQLEKLKRDAFGL